MDEVQVQRLHLHVPEIKDTRQQTRGLSQILTKQLNTLTLATTTLTYESVQQSMRIFFFSSVPYSFQFQF